MNASPVKMIVFSLISVLLICEVTSMKWSHEKPRQCYRRHPDYRWKDGEMPGDPIDHYIPSDPNKKNPNYKKHCSISYGPGDSWSRSIDLEEDCVLENCTFDQTTCVRNTKIQEKNDTYMVILEGCDKPPAEVPDMDEKNDFGMAGKLWEEYCENLLINHMRPVYKVKEYKCYCPNHGENVDAPCNGVELLMNNHSFSIGLGALIMGLLRALR